MGHSIHARFRSTLTLARSLRERLGSSARACYPHEACGLLLGHVRGKCTQVVDVREARNLQGDGEHNLLDPVDHLLAEEDARRKGLDVVGVWHSHPDHPAQLSTTDRTHAWSGWSYLIFSVDQGGVHEPRAWRLEGSEFLEEDVEVQP